MNILKINAFLLFSFLALFSFAQKSHNYKVVKTFKIQSSGGWDYIAVNGNNLFVSHGTQVNILNKITGDSVGVIPNTSGVHGIAFDVAHNKGFTSNGRSNNSTVFDLNTLKATGVIATGQNPDAICYEPFSKTIITCNGRSNDLTIIDPVTEKVISTIPVGGKPETAVSDGAGKIFVNIEDKSEVAVINMKTFVVENTWSVAPGEGPTGLAYDESTQRLFVGCDNELLIVLDATTGRVVDKLKIGKGCDGVVFDKKNKLIFTSNGEGTITGIKEQSSTSFSVVGNYTTKPGARTLILDNEKGILYLPTSDFEQTSTQNERRKMIPGTFQILVVQ